MRCKKTGVLTVEMYMENKEIYRIWSADKYRCPLCGVEVITGFGNGPYVHSAEESCEKALQKFKDMGREVVLDKEVAERCLKG
jgi:hypothetical protein